MKNHKPLLVASIVFAVVLIISVIMSLVFRNPAVQKAENSIKGIGGSNLVKEPFTITSMTQPAKGWFVASVRVGGQTSATQIVILRQERNGSMSVVAGPGTSFDFQALQRAGTPSSVINKLVVFNSSLSLLPYTDPGNTFQIGIADATPTNPALFIVTINDQYRSSALSWLKSRGINLPASRLIFVHDGLIGKLPYASIDFGLLANGYLKLPDGEYIPQLKASLNIPAAFANDPEAAESSYENEVISYLSSLGLDPSGYSISFTLQ